MIKTWFKNSEKFNEEEISILKQNGFFIGEDQTFAELPTNSEINITEIKKITKYSNFFVSYSFIEHRIMFNYADAEIYKNELEEDFKTLEDSINFFKNK